MKSIMSRDEAVDKEYLKQLELNTEKVLNQKERLYLILYYAQDKQSGEEIKSWEPCYGRKKAYDFIKNMIEFIDLEQSVVLSEQKDSEGNIYLLSYDDERVLSAFDFMKHMKSFIDDPTFDIDDYK